MEGNDNRPRPRFGPAPNTRPTAPTQRITCADWLSSLVDNIGAVLGAIITVMIFMLVFGSLLWAFGFGFHNYPYIGRDHPRDFKQRDGCREKLACRKQLDVYHKIQSVPYCQDRQEFLEAMGEGKRFGLDAPYYPKGLLLLVQFSSWILTWQQAVITSGSTQIISARSSIDSTGLPSWVTQTRRRYLLD